MTPASTTRPDTPLARWERLGLGIRCAYNPGQPAIIRHWLALGLKLAQGGIEQELPLLQRSLRLLLQTAQDEALPWFWRSVCLEHTTWPAARLVSLLRCHDPLGAEAVHDIVQHARDTLLPWPPTGSAAR